MRVGFWNDHYKSHVSKMTADCRLAADGDCEVGNVPPTVLTVSTMASAGVRSRLKAKCSLTGGCRGDVDGIWVKGRLCAGEQGPSFCARLATMPQASRETSVTQWGWSMF